MGIEVKKDTGQPQNQNHTFGVHLGQEI